MNPRVTKLAWPFLVLILYTNPTFAAESVKQLVHTIKRNSNKDRVRDAALALKGKLGPKDKREIYSLAIVLRGHSEQHRVRAAGVALQGNLDFDEVRSSKEMVTRVLRSSSDKNRVSAAKTALVKKEADPHHSPHGHFVVTTYEKLYILFDTHSGEAWIFPTGSINPIHLHIQNRFDDMKEAIKWIKKKSS